MTRRIKELRYRLHANHLDGFLATYLPDVYYLTGFTGSNAALLVTANKATLFTDGRYTQQAREEVSGAKIVIVGNSAAVAALESLPPKFRGIVGIDAAAVNIAAYASLRKTARRVSPNPKLKPIASPVAELRQTKDSAELARMRRAANLGSELFAWIRPHIHPGVRETEIAAQLEFTARQAGAEKMSFDTIVAGGARGALPHGVASRARLPRNGLVVLDFGVILDGYCSDMTRTLQLGKPTRKAREAYAAVLEAEQAAIAATAPGVTCGEVDAAARNVLRKARLGRYFTHSTGHGVGIEIHEAPRVARNEKTVLQPGMVITIEPGVYIPGEFGIRIEDMVAVTTRGHEVLTSAPKEWTA